MAKKMTPREVQKKLQQYNLDQERNKKRFEMFDKNTYKKVLALNAFFGKYVIQYETSYNRHYIYYDTENRDLEVSGVSIFKQIRGSRCELVIARSSVEGQSKILERLNGRKYSTPIGVKESPLKKIDFLKDHFKDMFAYAVEFDPEYLLRKINPVYTIDTSSVEYKLFNGVGLKVRFVFDHDEYYNAYTSRRNSADMLTLYQLSNESTDEAFFDVVSKLERYCKELSPAPDHKTTILYAKTKEIPKQDKAEQKRAQKAKENENKF